MICTFIGASSCNTLKLSDALEYEIRKLIECGISQFYNGGYGDFDILALKTVGKLKGEYPHIKSYIVLAYLTDKHVERMDSIAKHYGAETFYPFDQKVIPRFAILKRNEYMINSSDFIISHAGFGGSLTALEYAIRKKKMIIYV
ncbi:MAG: hypothetical protein R3Y32_05175 [Bacillota bacterium]